MFSIYSTHNLSHILKISTPVFFLFQCTPFDSYGLPGALRPVDLTPLEQSCAPEPGRTGGCWPAVDHGGIPSPPAGKDSLLQSEQYSSLLLAVSTMPITTITDLIIMHFIFLKISPLLVLQTVRDHYYNCNYILYITTTDQTIQNTFTITLIVIGHNNYTIPITATHNSIHDTHNQ